MNAPVVILIRPQMGENIGAVARAMSNFGLPELRIVAPRDGWPNPKALEMSSGGASIIESATVFDDFAAAMADVQLAYATTARPRDMQKEVMLPDVAVNRLAAQGVGVRTALVFGPERSGMENSEIAACDAIVSIATSPQNPSLNLAQCSVVMGYEWWRAQGDTNPARQLEAPAPRSEWQGLFSQLEGYLDAVAYFRVPSKKPVMWQNIQNMLLRAKWNAQEVRTFRGVLRSLATRDAADD